MITATFNGVELKKIEGYRISCRVTPSHGFANDFFVYIDERQQAKTPFENKMKVSATTSGALLPVRGTLVISDEDRSYQFQNIDVTMGEFSATRSERKRYFEFSYDEDVLKTSSDAITINGKRTTPLDPAGLGEDYMGGVDESRNLLGFRAHVSAKSNTAVRLSNIGCMPGSFLAKAVELNQAIVTGDKVLPQFSVKFSQGDFDVTKDNLDRMYVEESYGSMSLQPTLPLYHMLEDGAAQQKERLRNREYTANDLLWHDAARNFRALEVQPGTVEIATLVFKQGYKDLEIR